MTEAEAHKARIIEQILGEARKEDLFTPEEFHTVKTALEGLSLQELLEEYLPKWYGDLWRWQPVGMEEWLYSEDYMNLRGQIYPVLAQDLIDFFEGDYREAVIEGAIGWGKSYWSSLAICRMIYEISCYENPQLALGLANNSQIVIANIATKEKVAKEVVFEYVAGFIRGSEYFKRHFPPDKDLTKEILFPNKLRVMPAASTQGSVIGQNLYGTVLDEANFLFKGESERSGALNQEFDLAHVLWNTIQRRMVSRFGHKHPGKLLTVSSSMYPDDFTRRRWEMAQENDESVFYRRYSQWSTKPEYQNFEQSGRWFWLSIGDAGNRPRIVREPYEEDYDELLDDRNRLEEEGVTVIKVPEDFRLEFERDIDMAVRDVAGYATLSAYPFFRDISPLKASFERGKKRGLKHPWSVETTSLRDGSTWIKDYLDFDKASRHHFAHVDLALRGDAAGISIVRLDGIEEKKVETPVMNEATGELEFETTYLYEPQITGVLNLRIVSTQSQDIPIREVRKLIIDLLSWGFLFSFVSFDQFQSAESLQALQQTGIEADTVSVDRTLEPYNALKEALVEERLDLYPYEWIVKEAQALEVDVEKNKVDHPPLGSKDVTDALAGAVYNCVTFVRENPGLMVRGAFEDDDENYAGPTAMEFGSDAYDDELRDAMSWVLG